MRDVCRFSGSAVCVLLSMIMTSCMNTLEKGEGADSCGRIKVEFGLTPAGEFTRSALSADEGRVNDVSIFAYSDGTLEDMGYFTVFSDMSMELFPDKTYDFYAVANMGEVIAPVSQSDMPGFMYVIDSVSELSDGFPMCWSLSGFRPFRSEPVSVSLSRLVSKIVLKVENAVEGMWVSSARLVQSPLAVLPFADGGSRAESGMTASGDYASASDLADLNSGGKAVFYSLENMQGTLLPDNRDPMLKIPDSLTDRSDVCTYLEVSCSFEEGHDKEGGVVYRMYLGEDNVTDFDVERNRVLDVTLQLTSDGFGIRDSWKVVPDYIQHVTSLRLDEDEVTLKIGQECMLHAYVLPEDASDQTVIWESDDVSVASVGTDGRISALGEGSCVVRAISSDRPEMSSWCMVTVENKVEQLRFLSSEVSVALGSDGSAKFSPFNVEAVYSDGTVRDVTNLCGYSSSSASACVDVPGVLTHVSEGTSVISAEYDGVTATMIAVTDAFAIADVELNVQNLAIPLGDTFTLKFRVVYNDGTVSSWTPYGLAGMGIASANGWYSNDYSVADVNTYGVVRPVSVGRTDISVTVTDTGKSTSFTESVTVVVSEAYVVDVYVAASPMFSSGNYSLALMGIFSDGTESAIKADSWSVSTPYVTFSDGSAGLQISDEDKLVEGSGYVFTATYEGWTSAASMKYGKWVLDAGLEKTPVQGEEKYCYRMYLVMCDHTRKYVPFTCRYSSSLTGWESIDTASDSVVLWYYCPYVEAVSSSEYYDWQGLPVQWTARNF